MRQVFIILSVALLLCVVASFVLLNNADTDNVATNKITKLSNNKSNISDINDNYTTKATVSYNAHQYNKNIGGIGYDNIESEAYNNALFALNLKKDEVSEAEEELTKVIELEALNGNIDLLKGSILRDFYAKNGELEKYNRFLNDLPDTIDNKSQLLVDQVRYYKEQGLSNYDSLLPILEKEASSTQQYNPEIQNSLADVYEQKGETDKAINKYLYTISIDNKNQYAYYRLSVVYSAMGENKLSDEALQMAEDISASYNETIDEQ